MTERHIPDDELGLVLDLDPADPRRGHLDRCPRCYARMAEYRDFVAAQPGAPGARLGEARERLGEALEREIAGGAAERGTGRAVRAGGGDEPRPAPWLDRVTRGLHLPRLRPELAMAAIAVVIVAGGAWLAFRGREGIPPPPGGEPTLRGEVVRGPLTLEHPSVLADGALELAWTSMPGATRYQVRFVAPDLSDLATVEAGSDTRVILRRGSLPGGLASRALVTWQVVAMSGNDTLATSRATPVRLP
jgi:hypothetical protein